MRKISLPDMVIIPELGPETVPEESTEEETEESTEGVTRKLCQKYEILSRNKKLFQ